MRERLYYAWLRFRSLIVLGILVLAVGGGVLVSILSAGVGNDPQADDADTIVEEAPAGVASVDDAPLRSVALRERCASYGDTSVDLHACRSKLPRGLPLLLDTKGATFLTESGWRSVDGIVKELTPGVATLLANADSGFSADLDNDGSPEYGVITETDGARKLRIFSLDAQGELYDTTAARLATTAFDARAAIPWDVDRDGWSDLLLAGGARRERLRVALNAGWEGPGLFSPTKLVMVDAPDADLTDPADWLTTDLDVDGNVDLVMVGSGGFGLLVTSSTADERPSARTFPLPPGATGVEAVDIDLDGKLDLVASFELGLATQAQTLCLSDTDGRPCEGFAESPTQGGIAVLLQGDPLTFTVWAEGDLPVLPYASSVESVDIDSDGELEVIVASENPSDTDSPLAVLARSYDTQRRVNGLALKTRISSSAIAATRLGVWDFDQDGSPEIALLGRGAQDAGVVQGAGEPARYLHIRVRGAASIDSGGSEADAVGALIEIRDVDGSSHKTVVDDRARRAMLIALPLPKPAWSGREAVPEVEVFFPQTGRRILLKNVEVNQTLTVKEPAA